MRTAAAMSAAQLSPQFRRALLLWVLLPLLLAGCDTGSTNNKPNAEDARHPPASPRIVCLSPALTQMLIDLGEQDHLVGVGQHDNSGLGLPVCGNYQDPDIERILALETEIVLTQGGAGDPIPARLQELETAGVLRVVVLPHARKVKEVGRALNDPELGLGTLLGVEGKAAEVSRQMQAQLEAVTQVVAQEPRPRVLMLLSTAPMGAVGPGVTHDELLRRAGGVNVLADADVGYVQVDRQMLIDRLRPDVILLLSPGAPPLSDNDTRLRPFAGLPIRAVWDDRVLLINHPQAMLPSSSLPMVLAEIAKALHPSQAEAINRAMAESAEAGAGASP